MKFLNDTGRYHYLWVVIATSAGILIASQPITTSLAVLFGVVFGFFIIMQPVISVSFLLILSPFRALLLTEAPQLAWLEPGMVGIVLTLSIYVLYRVLRRTSWLNLRINQIHWVLLAFILVTWVSSFSAYSYQAWIQDWLKWVLILLLMFLLQTYHKYWRWLILSLVTAGVANAMIGIYIFLGGSGADHLVIMERFFRAFGTFGQPNPFGGYMGLILPVSISITGYSLIHALIKKDRNSFLIAVGTGLATLIMLFALLASWSRGAWLGFVCALVAMIISAPKSNQKRILILSIASILFSVIWSTNLLPSTITQRIEETAQQYLSFSEVRGLDITTINYAGVERIAHWQAAMNMVVDHPWTGVGLGNYEIAYAEYRLQNWPEALGHAHNYYLNILAEGGIITLLSFVTLWITIITTTWKARNHPDRSMRWISIGLLGSWVYISIHSLIDNLYVNNLYFHIAVMLAIVSMISNQIQHPFRWRHNDTVIGYQI